MFCRNIHGFSKLQAAGCHLIVSVAVASVFALLVFGVWYPYPYREISGGRELFVLIVVVDVILGPLITLLVFTRKKSEAELIRDLIAVVILQCAALSYGLWTVFLARPVYMVFEIDRFRIVHAIDIDASLLPLAPKNLRVLPIAGPGLLALRPFHSDKEKFEITMAALQGFNIASQPNLWIPYNDASQDVLNKAAPVEYLLHRFPSQALPIERVLQGGGRNAKSTVYLPLVSRKVFWTVFLDPVSAEVVAAMPIDSF